MLPAETLNISESSVQFQSVIMDSGQISKKDLKVEIPSETEMISRDVDSYPEPASGQGASSGLGRQPSITKTNCLCSPATHAGSFRCRLHLAPSLQRTKSIDSQSGSLLDSTSKPNSATATATATDSATASPTDTATE
ncbi:hypothetical protein REPUB_Repub01dG0088000 [Reevesia pubescens]